ncbi:hypothetical protein CDD81_7700 [Ophiocordyceps australis]|uniref:Methyltransferase type 11 domain-containing protein n=1 Tax=Ophiocordyceps australis TaxID=1399860 RepID=A0A2C5Y4Z9_9HYPO|nr:hypothetical protein CDD81_7700 [Ophiocordyceps australis]
MATFSGRAAETLYDEVIHLYEDAYGSGTGIFNAIERIKSHHAPGSSVLDLGCGPGSPASELANAGFKVTGLDISQRALDICRERKIPGTFAKHDATTWDTKEQFDAVLMFFTTLTWSYRATYSVMFKVASWMRPGATFVLGTVDPQELKDDKRLESVGYIERYPGRFLGKDFDATLITAEHWLDMIQQTGLSIVNVERFNHPVKERDSPEPQFFITATKRDVEPLYGPYPIPMFARPAQVLDKDAWLPFAERLCRVEFDVALKAPHSTQLKLDTLELSAAIAKQAGHVHVTDLSAHNDTTLPASSAITISRTAADHVALQARAVDAVIAVWILQYVDDVEKTLTEMTRVIDRSAPNARIVLIQGAPDHEVLRLVNRACLPLADAAPPPPIHHQGQLLATAARVLSARGFGSITLERVDPHCSFQEDKLETRCAEAAAVLTNMWYKEHPQADKIKQTMLPLLREHFADRPFEIGTQSVIMVAQPSPAS